MRCNSKNPCFRAIRRKRTACSITFSIMSATKRNFPQGRHIRAKKSRIANLHSPHIKTYPIPLARIWSRLLPTTDSMQTTPKLSQKSQNIFNRRRHTTSNTTRRSIRNKTLSFRFCATTKRAFADIMRLRRHCFSARSVFLQGTR